MQADEAFDGHFMPHKAGTTPPVAKLVLMADEYLGAGVVVQFDLAGIDDIAAGAASLCTRRNSSSLFSRKAQHFPSCLPIRAISSRRNLRSRKHSADARITAPTAGKWYTSGQGFNPMNKWSVAAVLMLGSLMVAGHSHTRAGILRCVCRIGCREIGSTGAPNRSHPRGRRGIHCRWVQGCL